MIKLFIQLALLTFPLTYKVQSNIPMHRHSIDSSLTIYVFLSTSCSMSQYYVDELNTLQDSFSDDGLLIIGIFPNFYEKVEDILRFKDKYGIKFKISLDTSFYYTEKLGASITPQAFLLDSRDSLVYSGLIDDGFFMPGVRKGTIKHHYLMDAIRKYFNDKEPNIRRTEPIGCRIVKE